MKTKLKQLMLIILIFISFSIVSYSQWTKLAGGNSSILFSDITQTPSGKIFAAGTSIIGQTFIPLVLRSTNNGTSWDTIIVPPTGYLFNTIAFLNDKVGYIGVGGGAYLLQTVNGGNSWFYFFQDTASSTINDIDVIDSANAVACGFGKEMYSSGSAFTLKDEYDWNPISQKFPKTSLDDIQMINKDTGYVLSISSKLIMKTSNGGTTWDSLYNFPTSVEKMFWWNSNNGIAVGLNATYYKTNDAGKNWTKDTIKGYTQELTGVAFFDSNNGYICSEGGNIFQSSDGGKSWKHLPSIVTTYLSTLEIHGNNAYAVGDKGVILRASNPTEVVDDTNSNFITLFPNPTTSYLQINQSEFNEETMVDIYDLLGNKIITTKAQQKIDVSQLKIGNYFLKYNNKIQKFIKY